MYDSSEQSVSISGFFRYLAHHWFLPVLFLILAPFLGYGYTALQTPMYSSTAKLVVLDSGNQSANVSRSIILGNYVTLAQSPKVIDDVSKRIDEDTDAVISNLTVTNESGTEAISIRYNTPRTSYSASVVTRIIDSFTNQLGELYDIKSDAIVILTTPTDSEVPYNIDYPKNIALALVVAAILGLVVTFIRFDREQSHELALDPLLNSKEEIERKKRLLAEKEAIREKESAARRAEVEARAVEAKVRSAEAETRIAKARADQTAAAASDIENRSRIAEAEARIEAAAALKKKVELESIQREEQLREFTITTKRQAELNRERIIELEKINTEKAVLEAKAQLNIARAVADRRFKTGGTPLSPLQPLPEDQVPPKPSLTSLFNQQGATNV